MTKTIKKSTSTINRKSNNTKKLNQYSLNSIQVNRKKSFKLKNAHPIDNSYHPDANNHPSVLWNSNHPAENYNHEENENNLHCNSSTPDLSSMNELIDLTVDSYECISIDDGDNASEFKNVHQKRQEQVLPYPIGTSFKQQCDPLPINGGLARNKKKFEKDLKFLLAGIQSQVKNGKSNQTKSTIYFNAIQRLSRNCYIEQLLQEKTNLDRKFHIIKNKLHQKCCFIADKTSHAQQMYQEILKHYKFPMYQKRVIRLSLKKMKHINTNVSNTIDMHSSDDTAFLPKELVSNLPRMRDAEINADDVFANRPFPPEEISMNQPEKGQEIVSGNNLVDSEVSSVIEPEANEKIVVSRNPLPVLQKQDLIDAKLKVSILLEQLKATQDELKKVRHEMIEHMNNSQQNVDSEQMKMKVQLSEIRAMLMEVVGSCTSIGDISENSLKDATCQSIVWNIRWLLEEYGHLNNNERTKNITGTVITTEDLRVTENEVQLVILIAFFLKVIPFSVTTEFIHTYLKNIDNSISLQFVTSLLNKFPTVFKGESVSAGSLEKKWCYLSLSPVITI